MTLPQILILAASSFTLGASTLILAYQLKISRALKENRLDYTRLERRLEIVEWAIVRYENWMKL